MQSDFSSFDDHQPVAPSEHHHVAHHHIKPAASSFSLLKALLIAGPLVFVLLLVVITASVNKSQQPTQMVQTDQQSTMQQPQQTNTDTQPADMNYVPPQNSENKMQAQGVRNYGKLICNGDIKLNSIAENPACTGDVNADVTTYITRYEIANISGSNGRSFRTYRLSLHAQSNFCKKGTGNSSGYKCEYVAGPTPTGPNPDPGEQLTAIQMDIAGGEKKIVEIKRTTPSGLGSGDANSIACGDFQTDLWISQADQIVGNVNEKCTWTDTSPQLGKAGWNLLGAAVCGTNKNCVNVTPTPTTRVLSPTPTRAVVSPTPTKSILSPTPTKVVQGAVCINMTHTALQMGGSAVFTCTGVNAKFAQFRFFTNGSSTPISGPLTVTLNNGVAQFGNPNISANVSSAIAECRMCNDTNGNGTLNESTCTPWGAGPTNTSACGNTFTFTPLPSPTRTPTPPPAAVSCTDLTLLGSFLPTDPARNVSFQCKGQNGTSAVARSYADGQLIGTANAINAGNGFWQGNVAARQYTNTLNFTCQICSAAGCSPESACTKSYTPPPPTPPPGSPVCTGLTADGPISPNGVQHGVNFTCTGQNATLTKMQLFANGTMFSSSQGGFGWPVPGQAGSNLNIPAIFQSSKVTCVLCNSAGCTDPNTCMIQWAAPTSTPALPTPTCTQIPDCLLTNPPTCAARLSAGGYWCAAQSPTPTKKTASPTPTKIVRSPTPPITTGLCPTADSGVSLKNGFYVANATTSLSHVTSRHNISSNMRAVSGGKYLFVIPDRPTSTQNPYYGSFIFRNTQGVPVVNVWPYDADHVTTKNPTKVRITLKNGSYFKPTDHIVDSSGKITIEKTANNTFAKPVKVNGYVTKIEYFPGKDSNGWDSSEFGVDCPQGAALPSINLGEPVEEVSVWSSFFQLVRDLFSF